MTGLTVSSLDRWFMGPVPNLSPEDLGIPTVGYLDAAIETARKVLSDPDTFLWPLVRIFLQTNYLERYNLTSVALEPPTAGPQPIGQEPRCFDAGACHAV